MKINLPKHKIYGERYINFFKNGIKGAWGFNIRMPMFNKFFDISCDFKHKLFWFGTKKHLLSLGKTIRKECRGWRTRE